MNEHKASRKADRATVAEVYDASKPHTFITLSVRNDKFTTEESGNPNYTRLRLSVPCIESERIHPIVELLKGLGLTEPAIDNVVGTIQEELAVECLREMIERY